MKGIQIISSILLLGASLASSRVLQDVNDTDTAISTDGDIAVGTTVAPTEAAANATEDGFFDPVTDFIGDAADTVADAAGSAFDAAKNATDGFTDWLGGLVGSEDETEEPAETTAESTETTTEDIGTESAGLDEGSSGNARFVSVAIIATAASAVAFF